MNKLFFKNAQNYIDLRQSLGFQVRKDKNLLYAFYDFLILKKAPHITTALALEFACQNPHASRAQYAYRLGVIKRFAIYMQTLDPKTEIPPTNLLPFSFKRRVPFIYSDKNIATAHKVEVTTPQAGTPVTSTS